VWLNTADYRRIGKGEKELMSTQNGFLQIGRAAIPALRERARRVLALIAVALVFSLSWAPADLLAATYYVDDSNGNDSNAGTENSPWLSVQHAMETLVAGDHLLIRAGTYHGEEPIWSRPAFHPKNNGTASAPIVIESYPGETVIMTGSLGCRDNSYVTWRGFTVDHENVKMFSSDHCVLDGLTIFGQLGRGGDNVDGIRVQDSVDGVVRNCRIFDIWNENRTPNSAGIKLYDGTRITIEHNEIFDTGNGLYDKDGGDSNIFRFNFLHDCSANGIAIQSHNGDTIMNDRVYGNLIVNSDAGVRITGSASDSPNKNTWAWNNTSVRCRTSYVVSSTAENARVWNNIAVDMDKAAGLASSGLDMCDYNLFYLSGDSGCGSNDLMVDPLFVGSSLNNPEGFKLHPNSPALNSGSNGEHRGAYMTGSEVIGIVGEGGQPPTPDTEAPAAPTGLRILQSS
jgi:hypothetical protein